MPPKKILFFVPYPLHVAPSQRFRVEQYFPLLDHASIPYKVSSFLDEETYRLLYNNASPLTKAWGVLKGFVRRIRNVFFDVHGYDFVFVHREASPVGPPIFEWIISRVWGKKIVYDFDDAIWIPDSQNKLLNWVKATWKIRKICSWSYKVAGGNDFLCRYASQFNKKVVLLPTCVDTVKRHNRIKDQHTGNVVIGWTGSHSTLRFLDPLVPLLKKLVDENGAEFLVICNQAPAFSFPGLRFIRWSEETEVDDLLQVNIGIMPLQDDAWSEGKCGFKLIQYLALGIPALASPVGVNRDIIEEGVNGYLCSNDEEWESALLLLMNHPEKRQEMGMAGREKIKSSYSTQANADVFLSLFD